ncbi:phage tail tape measure protein [Tumebacillus sp. ITR2]|uniref:Phage tail tape measure protein n=1 Tax=Tumebacillus amylolyticus TaxID=2801339 RepID=A0ABS1JCC0_9BACL|nr:phage tail tape measure protein [Tumebacillus amylolyticus]MBL0387925.1 phage tail tape measure protein [Tumebacillus amylolyticus]
MSGKDLQISLKITAQDQANKILQQTEQELGKMGKEAKAAADGAKNATVELGNIAKRAKELTTGSKEVNTQLDAMGKEAKTASASSKALSSEIGNISKEAREAAQDARKMTSELGGIGREGARGLREASEQAKQLRNNISNVGSKKPDMNWLSTMSTGLTNVSKVLGDVSTKLEAMKMSGLSDVAVGTGMLAGIYKTTEQAGEIQMKNIELGGVYGLSQDSPEMTHLNQEAKDLSSKTLFSTHDILGIDTELAHAQISKEKLSKVTPEATYLAEIEVGMGKSSSAGRTAYNFARMAEDAGITNDEKKLSKFSDSMYRVINTTHASSEGLGETFKYGMPVVKKIGWDENDMLQASAMAAINGMEGSMAGVHIKDYAQRINPFKYLGSPGGQKQLGAMEDAGLISGVQYDAKGKKIVGFDSAALLSDKDHIKHYSDMIDVLSRKHDEFIAKGAKTQYTLEMTDDEIQKMKEHAQEMTGQDLTGGELEWAALMNHIFGEQGQDFALISSHPEQYAKLNNSLGNQKDLHTQIDTIRDSYEGQKHILLSNLGNLSTEIGNALLPGITDLMKELQPSITSATEWVKANGETVREVAKWTGEIGGFVLAIGAAKLALGGVGSALSPLMNFGKNFVDLVDKQVVSPLKNKYGKTTVEDTIPTKAINANVVNVYGKMVDNVGGNPANGGGVTTGTRTARTTIGETASVAGVEAQTAERAASQNSSRITRALQSGKQSISGALDRGKFMLPVTAAIGVYDVVTAPEGHKVEAGAKASGNIIGGWAGAEAGAAFGATVGSIVPGVGTAIGGVLGGIIGGIAGSVMADKVTDSLLGIKANAESILGSVNTGKGSIWNGYGGSGAYAQGKVEVGKPAPATSYKWGSSGGGSYGFTTAPVTSNAPLASRQSSVVYNDHSTINNNGGNTAEAVKAWESRNWGGNLSRQQPLYGQ